MYEAICKFISLIQSLLTPHELRVHESNVRDVGSKATFHTSIESPVIRRPRQSTYSTRLLVYPLDGVSGNWRNRTSWCHYKFTNRVTDGLIEQLPLYFRLSPRAALTYHFDIVNQFPIRCTTVGKHQYNIRYVTTQAGG